MHAMFVPSQIEIRSELTDGGARMNIDPDSK